MVAIIRGIVLGILVVLIPGLIIYKYWSAVVGWLAEQKEVHEKTFRSTVVILLVTVGIANGILVDVVDVSDALSNDNQYSRQEVDTIIKELPNYGVSKETSLDDRIRTAFERLVTRPNRWVTGGMVCALTVLASVFIAVSVLDQASDHSLDERRRRLEYMQKQFNACWNVIQGIRQIVLTKLFNIKNALESCEKIAQRDSCRDCVTILDPDGQIQTMVESAHGWFRSMGSEPAALRVALYIEDDVH